MSFHYLTKQLTQLFFSLPILHTETGNTARKKYVCMK